MEWSILKGNYRQGFMLILGYFRVNEGSLCLPYGLFMNLQHFRDACITLLQNESNKTKQKNFRETFIVQSPTCLMSL